MEVSMIRWNSVLWQGLVKTYSFWKTNVSLNLELIALGKHRML
jgi:hypothetical protein